MKRPGAALAVILAVVSALAYAGCGDDSASGEMSPNGGGYGGGAGKGDGGGGGFMDSGGGYFDAGGPADTYVPPEKPVYSPKPPVSSVNYVYVLNASNGTVVRINPATLEVKSIKVGAQPKALLTIENEDTAVVLSSGARSLTVVRTAAGQDHVTRIPVGARYTSMTISPDGRYVVAYYNDRDQDPANLDQEQKLCVVDLQAEGPECTERAVGFRVTDIFFSAARGEAYVLAKSAVYIIPFASLGTTYILPQIAIDKDVLEEFIEDIPHRSAISAGDAEYIMIRGLTSQKLLVINTQTRGTHLLDLGGVPTDLQTTRGASYAVAVLRDEALVKKIKIPEGFTDAAYVTAVDVSEYSIVGTVRIAENAAAGVQLAILYTNAVYSEELLLLDLSEGAPDKPVALGNTDNLNKAIYNIAVSPDGLSALVIHQRATVSAETDPIEKRFDESEGYSAFRLPAAERSIATTLTRYMPGPYVFSGSGLFCAVAVESKSAAVHEVHLLNMATALPMSAVTLDTPVIYVGALPESPGRDREVFYFSQEHAAGRITFVTMPSAGGEPEEIRTVTGFEINSEIE